AYILGIQLVLYPTEVVNYFFEAKVKSKYPVIARLIGFFSGVIIKLIIVFYGGTLVHLAIAYAVEFLLVGVFYLWFGYQYGVKFRRWQWDAKVARKLFKESRYLVLAAIMVTFYMQMDKPMVYKMVGERENGLYSFAVLLAEACYFLPVVISQSAFPNLVASGQRDEQEFLKKIAKLARILFFVSVVIALCFTLSANFLVSILTKGKYADAGPMLQIVIWALPFVSLGTVQSAYLVNKKLVNYSLYLTGLGTIINLGMNLFLIPRYGGAGAAIATVVSYAFAGFFGAFFFIKTRPLSWLLLRALSSFR
ncbi:MAG: flippase, partial [Bacteroidota bacterium]